MKHNHLILLWLLLSSYSIEGQPSTPLAIANAMVEKGNYMDALTAYMSIQEEGDISAELYFNMANTFLQVDSVASAILYYEKALRISPRDNDILNNLEIAKGRVEDQVTLLPEFFLIAYWEDLYNSFSANTWAIFSIVSFCLLSILLFMVWYKGVPLLSRKMVVGIVACLLLFIISIAAGYARKSHDIGKDEAIVFMKGFMKSGPDERSDDLKLLHQGYKIFIMDRLNGWSKIRTEDREIGWVRPGVYRVI